MVDGSPTGVITAELGNWSGKAVVAPRAALPELIKRDEASRTGVYLLMGVDPDNSARILVYVGESDNVRTRLVIHDADESKQFFTRICLIVSKDENLTKAHGRYLEARIMALVRAAARAVLVNGTEPDFRGLPEPEIADMEGFLSEIEVLLPVLGFDVLRRAAETGHAGVRRDPAEHIFLFTEAGTQARATEVGGEFVVLTGSLARVRETKSIDDGTKGRRRQLIEDGALTKTVDSQHYTFMRDVAFSSPSGAAAVVYGGRVSGPAFWKHEGDDLAYKDWRQQQLAQAQGGKE
ncbi:MAG: GIY-YIG nuclease family protein [Bryobacterales bacterium]|nr:GIY-YIG nuclease family protein [Bryobacterales bacterium]